MLTHIRFFVTIFVLAVLGVAVILILRNFIAPDIVINTNSASVIKELRSLNRLETASFTIEKIIEGGTTPNNIFQEILYGDRILLIAHGEVIAGFDLSTLSEQDIEITDKIIRLTLPPPMVLTTVLSNEKTRVYDRKQGFLSKGNKDLESQARLAAEQSIKDAACQSDILTQASDNARKQLTTLFKALGFTTVIIDIPQGSC